ncbi:hypothetical protein [Nocardia acidivorans]|uniref:hypothetical protein n=1 Tax=Nocardia acidivorans TaxID=404580 RepID=UPI000832E2DF|nr:hypothetical protein [Nocardia acidivorans]
MNDQGDELWGRPPGRRAEDAGAPRPDPVLRLLDEIDLLVEESMRDGEPRTGYDYDDPTYPDCPNPYCRESWHGLAITVRMVEMRDYGTLDPEYDYRADDSGVMCPGSDHDGEWPEPAGEWELEWDLEDYAGALRPASDTGAEPIDPRLAQADSMWMAVSRPATMVWVSSTLVAFLSMFLTPAHWRWLTPVIGIAAFCTLGWLLRRKRRRLPVGYLRERLCARPETIIALGLTAAASLLPAVWAFRSPLDSSGDVAAGYGIMLLACALAGTAHATVQLSRIRTVASESVDGAGETDRAAHATNLVVLSFFWLIFALPGLLLFGWTVGRFTFQPAAMWAAVGVAVLSLIVLFVESLVMHIITRDVGGILMIILFGAVIAAPLLWWSLHTLATSHWHL